MTMAEFECSGMDDLIKAMQGLDLFDEETQTELLKAGAEHLMQTIREEAGRSNYRLKSISAKLTQRKIKKDRDGNYYVTVTVAGKNSRGERMATVAFVLNYGRSKKYGLIPGSYFWTTAVRRAEKTVLPVYEEIVSEKIEERGLM